VVFRYQFGKNDGMETQAALFFPPFRLDVGSEQLWRDDEVVALRPKALAVLCYLVEHPERVVT
jgi:DNA-binding winged helix-turn-helix (wHTH) protein